MEKQALIFCSGDMERDETLSEQERTQSLVICADGGLRHAVRLGITPDVIIGDCDSAEKPYPPEILHFIYPSEKDVTDTQLCIDYAIEQGCTRILLLGATGGRLDHEFSHYSLLLYALRRGVSVRIRNHRNEIWMIDHPCTIAPNGNTYISFFPFGGTVEGFSLSNFKYCATDMTLTCDQVQASCNEFLSDTPGMVSFRSGTVLVMTSKDKG